MTGYTLSRGGTRNETLDELVGRDRKYQEDVLQPGGATVGKRAQKKHNNNNKRNEENIKQHNNCELRCHL